MINNFKNKDVANMFRPLFKRIAKALAPIQKVHDFLTTQAKAAKRLVKRVCRAVLALICKPLSVAKVLRSKTFVQDQVSQLSQAFVSSNTNLVRAPNR